MVNRFLKKITISGFKCFDQYSMTCREQNIIVGPNNAGKSTILDALRIAGDVTRFASRRRAQIMSEKPYGLIAIHSIPNSLISIDTRFCSYNFRDNKPIICLEIENESKIFIEIEPSGETFIRLNFVGNPPNSTRDYLEKFAFRPIVVPTLSPLEFDEILVEPETVERNQFTRLASRNFRNIWLHKSEEEFEEFSDLVASAWGGIRLQKPDREIGGDRAYVRMYFRRGPEVREVQSAGFGFQVWMQMMTHIMRADKTSTLVLDEPDIYLHPDLQHRLLNIVKERVGQFFIATHSTEIINDAEPGAIVSIGGDRKSAKRIRTESDFTEVLSILGSSENAEFARLARARRVLFFEGKDRRVFRRIADELGKGGIVSDYETAYLECGGFGQWERVKHTAWLVKQLFSMNIKVAAIFDRDYRSDEEIEKFLEEMRSENLSCWILPVKETENFLISPAIGRIVADGVDREIYPNWEDVFRKAVKESEESFRETVRASRIGEYVKFGTKNLKSTDPGTLARCANEDFERRWSDAKLRRQIIPGKDYLSMLFGRLKEELNVSLSVSRVSREMRRDEHHPDLLRIFNELEGYFKGE